MESNQPSLFPELFSEKEPLSINVDEIASHISKHARPVEYEDRTSEAARDQGHGPIRKPELPVVIDDPELNKAWHEEQDAKKRRLGSAAIKADRLTSKEKNKNERDYIAGHRKKVPKTRIPR